MNEITLEVRLILAGILLAVVGWFAWDWHHRGARIDALEAQHALDQAALAPLRQANADFKRREDERAAQDYIDRKQRERQAQEAAAALAAAQTQAATAQGQARLWEARYTARPATCSAALAALNSACPTLKDY